MLVISICRILCVFVFFDLSRFSFFSFNFLLYFLLFFFVSISFFSFFVSLFSSAFKWWAWRWVGQMGGSKEWGGRHLLSSRSMFLLIIFFFISSNPRSSLLSYSTVLFLFLFFCSIITSLLVCSLLHDLLHGPEIDVSGGWTGRCESV